MICLISTVTTAFIIRENVSKAKIHTAMESISKTFPTAQRERQLDN